MYVCIQQMQLPKFHTLHVIVTILICMVLHNIRRGREREREREGGRERGGRERERKREQLYVGVVPIILS